MRYTWICMIIEIYIYLSNKRTRGMLTKILFWNDFYSLFHTLKIFYITVPYYFKIFNRIIKGLKFLNLQKVETITK